MKFGHSQGYIAIVRPLSRHAKMNEAVLVTSGQTGLEMSAGLSESRKWQSII